MRLFSSLRLWTSLRQWLHYRATLRQLQQLSAYELEDLGLCRNELRDIARKAARPPAMAPAPDIIGMAKEAAA